MQWIINLLILYLLFFRCNIPHIKMWKMRLYGILYWKVIWKLCLSCIRNITNYYLTLALNITSDENCKGLHSGSFVKLCTSKRLSSTEYVRSYLLTSLKNVISDKLSSLRLTEDLNEHFFELKIEDTALESLFKR